MERQRTITWEDPHIGSRDADGISGLDYLKAIRDGSGHPPPVAHLIGYRLVEVDYGLAVFELEPAEFHYNPFATVHGGILSTLLDSAMTAAVMTTLDAGTACTTVEIKVNFIRPATAQTPTLRCEARPIHIGKRLATVQGWIRDRENVLHGHGVSTCAVFKTGK